MTLEYSPLMERWESTGGKGWGKTTPGTKSIRRTALKNKHAGRVLRDRKRFLHEESARHKLSSSQTGDPTTRLHGTKLPRTAVRSGKGYSSEYGRPIAHKSCQRRRVGIRTQIGQPLGPQVISGVPGAPYNRLDGYLESAR
jgi:hypothetical protein